METLETSYHGSATLDQLDQQDDKCEDQQDVNEST
jgi:hypothetical protein